MYPIINIHGFSAHQDPHSLRMLLTCCHDLGYDAAVIDTVQRNNHNVVAYGLNWTLELQTESTTKGMITRSLLKEIVLLIPQNTRLFLLLDNAEENYLSLDLTFFKGENQQYEMMKEKLERSLMALNEDDSHHLFPNMILYVDGRRVGCKPFIRELFYNTISGMVSALKKTSEAARIAITLEKL